MTGQGSTGNVIAAQARRVYDLWLAGSAEADAEQAALTEARAAYDGRPLIAALKAALLEETGDEVWRNLRPPLTLIG